jgi:superfamily II RNA helicase
MPEMPPGTLLAALGSYNLLPAIVFLPTRRRCDEAATEAALHRPARTVVVTVADRRTGHGWQSLSASELQQMTGRAGRRGKDRVGFIVAAPGPHQNPLKIAELLAAQPDNLDSQFRATYTSLLNLLDAFGNFSQVRSIAERSFAYRNLLPRIHELEQRRTENERAIAAQLERSSLNLSIASVMAIERLASARTRLLEGAPQTRREMRQRWLHKVVIPGRVVAVGRSGRRLALVTARGRDGVTAIKEDGRTASFPLQRIGRVFAPTFATKPDKVEEAFDEIHNHREQLILPEPRLRDEQTGEEDSLKLISDLIDSFTGGDQSAIELVWSLQKDASTIDRASRQIDRLRDEIWEPFERCAHVLHHYGYLDFSAERVTERGKWLADLRVDRPLLIGEALQRNLFASLTEIQAAALVAALAADEDRDYGQLEMEDAVVTLLIQFEEISFEVANEEWKYGIEAVEEINFSAAAAAALWASGVAWPKLVHETRAEEGDLVRLLSRTGEALLQIANLRTTHAAAASLASKTAEIMLREPVR